MDRATAEGTRAYARRMVDAGRAVDDAYRDVDGLSVSSVGLGTYLGDPDDETDLLYVEAILEAVALGCNVVDAAANYRYQRSERSIGEALERAIKNGLVDRAEVVVATKGGYIPFDGGPPASREAAKRYVAETFLDPGICRPEDFAANFQHCMSPAYLEHQVSQSLENLGVGCIDIYYIHNPEGQLREVGRDAFELRIREAFESLERQVESGRIARYGTATWNGFRVSPDAVDHLSLERLVAIAREVGGDQHHFRVIQLPYNLALPEAYASYNQPLDGELVTTLDAATQLGVSVFASASLMQSRLTDTLPDEVTAAMPMRSSAETALQFARSTPGVACALAGMARTAHVRQNLGVLKERKAPAESVRALFEEA